MEKIGSKGMKHNDQTDSRVYVLNKEYLRFKGIIALPYGDKDDSGISSMKIYGDDKLLFQSKEITKGYIPQKFDLHVTGVAHLKIVAVAEKNDTAKNIYPPSILFICLNSRNNIRYMPKTSA